MKKNPEELSIIISLLVSLMYEREGPRFADEFLHRLREHVRRSDLLPPELDEMFMFGFDREFSPKYRFTSFSRVRKYLRESDFWDPKLDGMLEYSANHPSRYRRERDIELESVTRAMLREFSEHIERGIERSSDNLKNQISGVREQTVSLEEKIGSLAEGLDHNSQELLYSKAELHHFQWLSSTGANIQEAKLHRHLPVRVYIADPVPDRKKLDRISERLNALAEYLGFELSDDLPEERGSWWKRIFYKTKELLTHDEVLERVETAEAALKLKHLDKPQAEANRAQAEAASQLITSLKDTTAACIQVGSLLLVKAPSSKGESAIFIRTLTPFELKELEENQSILGQPEKVLEWLQGCNSNNVLPPP